MWETSAYCQGAPEDNKVTLDKLIIFKFKKKNIFRNNFWYEHPTAKNIENVPRKQLYGILDILEVIPCKQLYGRDLDNLEVSMCTSS